MWFQLQFVNESSNQLSIENVVYAVTPTHEQEQVQWQSNIFDKSLARGNAKALNRAMNSHWLSDSYSKSAFD